MADESDGEFAAEAERLMQLTVDQREEALAVHRRIAGDATLSEATRDYARYVADSLINELARLARKDP